MLLVLMAVIGIIANPNTVPQKIDGFEWLPINLYINGDTFYYILYGMLGRAIGMMDTQHKALSWVSAALFATGVFIISRGTLYELQWRGICRYLVSLLWADGFYLRNRAIDSG